MPRLLSTTTYVDDILVVFADAAYDTALGGRGPVGVILWRTAETALVPPSAEAAATAEDRTRGRTRGSEGRQSDGGDVSCRNGGTARLYCRLPSTMN